MRLLSIITALSLLLLSISCLENGSANDENSDPNLRNTVPFPIGAAVQNGRLLNAEVINLFRNDFSSLTAEWEMKMSPMYDDPNAIDFSTVDQLVDFAESMGVRVHGHALLWHQATPGWLENYNGTDQQFEALIENYIKEVVGRYRGRIASWDVVNEAFLDGSGNRRQSVFQERIGDDYIEKAFRWAREADPDVILFYNDYGTIYDTNKFNAMMTMVDDLIAKDVPIDGVGFQMHISYNFPSKNQITTATAAIVQRDLQVHYSELDIRVNPEAEDTMLTLELLDRQKAKMDEILEVYSTVPSDLQFGITWWGVRDNETWLRDFWNNQNEWPLMLDDSYNSKPVYESFMEAYQ